MGCGLQNSLGAGGETEAHSPSSKCPLLPLSAVSHARLQLRHQVQEGLHRLSLLLRDSGQPPQQREQPLNVSVCHCSQDGTCLPGASALRADGAGVSLAVLVVVLASLILLLSEWSGPNSVSSCPHPLCPAPITTYYAPSFMLHLYLPYPALPNP